MLDSNDENGRNRKSLDPRGRWILGLWVVLFFAFPPTNLTAQNFLLKAASGKGSPAQPAVRISVKSLGYMPPGSMPSLEYQSLIGLHFIDETHLLFTFNIGGLVRRNSRCPASNSQRRVRAVVLEIPSGTVVRQADWDLYDFNDYLWGLGNGQFLLRHCSQYDLLGASLVLHPWIETSGSILGTFLSPDRSVAVIEKSGEAITSESPQPQSSANSSEDRPAKKVELDFVRLDPLAVVARAQVSRPIAVPIMAQGILEALGASHNRWVMNMKPFQGAEREIATMQSFCRPMLKGIAKDVFVAVMCPKDGQAAYRGYSLEGTLLWQMPVAKDRLSPHFILTKNGGHFAMESVHLKHPVAALDPVGKKDVDGLVIDIYDTHTGVLMSSLRTTPVYTAGDIADFSPDGTRMAILREGAIEIYTLCELAKNLN